MPYYSQEIGLTNGTASEVSDDLWAMVLRGVDCSGYLTTRMRIKTTLPPAASTANNNETDQYFYHSDHLGSSSFISDALGYATQHLQYLPYGETFVDQHGVFDSRYTFSAKEKDDETQYSYFGARYYDSDLSVWLSVDPLAVKYPSLSPYAYCSGNPIKYIDPNGEENVIVVGTSNNAKNEASRSNILNAAKRQVDALNANSGQETTILLYTPLYTQEELADIKNYVSQHSNVKLLEVTTDQEIINYINTKSTSGGDGGRSKDLINIFDYFGHGNNSMLLVAYGYRHDQLIGPGDLKKEAFSEFSTIGLYSCNNYDKSDGIWARGKYYPEYSSIGEYFSQLAGFMFIGNVGSVSYNYDDIKYQTGSSDPIVIRKSGGLSAMPILNVKAIAVENGEVTGVTY